MIDRFYQEIGARSLSIAHPTSPSFGRLRIPGQEHAILANLLILALPCCNLQLIHDAPRNRASPESWFRLLEIGRSSVDLHFLLWCVLPARGV